MKERQLGGTKYISFRWVKIPAGFFLEITGEATATVSVSLSSYK